MNQKDRRTRVFIIGAGLGGLSAAWFLSKHRPDVDVIVCEASWVPGGKAVSGRAAPPVGGGMPHFVEEHGLHMLFGTYQQTWQMLADCYEEVDRPVSHAFRRIEQAFTPQKLVVFDERGGAAGGNTGSSLPTRGRAIRGTRARLLPSTTWGCSVN
jgi:uncharacterized protein with NAD-binding domain and iron-sulfur cluster